MKAQRTYPPAWYPDPDNPLRLRRWDGSRWTRDTRSPPAWVRWVVLSPGPGGGAKRRTSRWLWVTSASLVGLAFLFMAALTRFGGAADSISDSGFTSQADALCAATRAEALAVDPATGPAGTDRGRRTAALVQGLAVMVDELHSLEVAADDAAEVERWLRAWDEFVATGYRRAAALDRGDLARAERADAEAIVPKQAIDRFARVNRIESCIF